LVDAAVAGAAAGNDGQAFKTAYVGGLHSQQVSFGNLTLEDDEAFVATVHPGGAGFRNFVVHDYWYISLDVANRTSCLNSSRAHADGRFTYVISARDPIKSQACATNLIGTSQWGCSDHPFKDDSFDYIVDPAFAASRLNRVIDQLESGAVPKERLFHIQYADLISRPIETSKALYAHFGLALSARGLKGMVDYLRAHPRTTRPKHDYVVTADPAALARERALFARYHRYFAIPNED
jgi:Sulfotransferase family